MGAGISIEQEIKNLEDARRILCIACGQIPGMGADFQKASHAMTYIDKQREPLVAQLLRDEDTCA